MLEQYQSQIAAALRPAFDRETADPDLTMVAMDAVVAFFTFHVSSDPVVFRRLTALLTSSLPDLARIALPPGFLLGPSCCSLYAAHSFVYARNSLPRVQ